MEEINPSLSNGMYRTPRAIFELKYRVFTTSKGIYRKKKIKKSFFFPHNRGKSLVSNYKFYHIKIYISRRRLLDHGLYKS